MEPSFAACAAAFVLIWLAACAVISWAGGWHELACRFRSDEPLDGEDFRFRSCSIGSGLFPANYGHVLFITIGPSGLALSVLLPFRFMHPRLLIPWHAVEKCEKVKFWWRDAAALHSAGLRLLFYGEVAEKLLAEWSRQGRA